eukprot:GHUV01025526.1.p1 GENE.GHUV01025526.1~~GHUV01025526.1.p1  ORF type:complete len:134 (-),score=24.08 GHUV01025526.1:544-945(-)
MYESYVHPSLTPNAVGAVHHIQTTISFDWVKPLHRWSHECTRVTSCIHAGDNSAPAVYDAVSAAISTGIGQHLPGPGVEGMGGAGGPSWRPRGVLASHLQEHRAAVNCLATSANGAILLSGSDDETVKVSGVV